MAKSKRWSMKDIKKIKSFITASLKTGGSELQGLIDASQHFGVTLNAVNLRWKRYHAGEQTSGLKGTTTKVPLVRKKRKYTLRKADLTSAPKAEKPTGRSMTFKITNVQVDLNKGEITVSY